MKFFQYDLTKASLSSTGHCDQPHTQNKVVFMSNVLRALEFGDV